jgi:hypothetical protein
MPRKNEPWYYVSKGGWFVKYKGRMISLRVKGRGNEEEALVALEKLKKGIKPEAPPKPTPPPLPVLPRVPDPVLVAGNRPTHQRVSPPFVDRTVRIERTVGKARPSLDRSFFLPFLPSAGCRSISFWLPLDQFGTRYGSRSETLRCVRSLAWGSDCCWSLSLRT